MPGHRLLALFAHPDDETSAAAGTFTRYAREGVEVYVATATRGELGTLGGGGTTIRRDCTGDQSRGESQRVRIACPRCRFVLTPWQAIIVTSAQHAHSLYTM